MFLKTLLIILSFLTLSLEGFSQKCKFRFDDTDPITNERVRCNFHNINALTKFAFCRVNDDFRFELKFTVSGEHNYATPKGKKIFIKLMNDEILELTSANEAAPVSFLINDQIATSYAISYHITESQMTSVSTHGISFMRAMLMEETSVTYKIKSKKNKKIKASATCIVTN